MADWKERNAMLQASLEKDPFLIAQAGERLKDCCVFPYLEWSRNATWIHSVYSVRCQDLAYQCHVLPTGFANPS